MIRASGAMLVMTALQMATESFVVPKSVMKTMVGRAAVSLCAGCLEQDTQQMAKDTERNNPKRRMRRGIRKLFPHVQIDLQTGENATHSPLTMLRRKQADAFGAGSRKPREMPGRRSSPPKPQL